MQSSVSAQTRRSIRGRSLSAATVLPVPASEGGPSHRPLYVAAFEHAWCDARRTVSTRHKQHAWSLQKCVHFIQCPLFLRQGYTSQSQTGVYFLDAFSICTARVVFGSSPFEIR